MLAIRDIFIVMDCMATSYVLSRFIFTIAKRALTLLLPISFDSIMVGKMSKSVI